MSNKTLKKAISILLCALLVLLVISSALMVFHHCTNHSLCPVCNALDSFSALSVNILVSVIFSGIVLIVLKFYIRILFSLVQKRVRINC